MIVEAKAGQFPMSCGHAAEARLRDVERLKVAAAEAAVGESLILDLYTRNGRSVGSVDGNEAAAVCAD